ncbi:F-box domain-containing protein [Abeliophyllum distichum]|uniref:F-box domain-containing protein n=1 Tax=Abeliophyllum distichum TaxID=126358 RepID=A0ABD1QZ61_9LAMI
MKNISSLVDVTLDMADGLGQNEFDCDELLSLLASLRNVENFTISGWLLEIDQRGRNIACPHLYHYWHEPYFWVDHSVLKSTSLLLEHLKVVQITGFEIQEETLSMVDILLKKALMLNSMSIKSRNDIHWQIVKFPSSQLKIANRSQPKKMTNLAPNKDYYLGFIEEDSI